MPTRSLNTSVIRWLDARTVECALRQWAERTLAQHPEIRGIGYFGSYARGDWSVGSDLDVVLIVASARQPFERRAAEWDMLTLPIPVDLLVYTLREWEALDRQSRFYQMLVREAVWVYTRDELHSEAGP